MIDTSRRLLIFDGDCGFCRSTARYIVARSTTPIEIHAWQLVDVTQFGLTEAETARRVYFVTKGEAFGGHLALAQVLWLQRGDWVESARLADDSAADVLARVSRIRVGGSVPASVAGWDAGVCD